MNIERLKRLVTILESVSDDNFSMVTFKTGNKACVLGHYIINTLGCGIHLEKMGHNSFWPVDDKTGKFPDLKKHFGLNGEQVTLIFYSRDFTDTRAVVISRIKRVIYGVV